MMLSQSARVAGAACLALMAALPLPAQQRSAARASAPLSDIRYEVKFDSASASQRTIRVTMSFEAGSAAPVLLSLPAWTPGAYEVSNFAANILTFDAESQGRPAEWDKVDPDTWRVRPGAAGPVTVRYDVLADSLDNAMAWAQADFAFFNGTNLFFYPEGQGWDFPASVAVHTQPGWRVRTAMHRAPAPDTWHEQNYHDLVDMPFFVGRFDDDSMMVAGRWQWLATWPVGALRDSARTAAWHDLARMTPAEIAVTGTQPWDQYVTFMVFTRYPGGSALEHQSSHLGIYDPQFIGTPVLPSVTAHEMFHAWNVKRLRPAEMVPYNYEHWQPTPLLWVSEGITDYYADLALVRGGIVDSAAFFETTAGKIQNVDDAPAVALEDASLSTWIHPKNGTGYLYYPKGSLAGFMLDILIRDASDNAHGLDDVLRDLYQTTYLKRTGFTTAQFLATASRMAGGRSFQSFYERYVNGRDPYPWDSVLPLGGLRLRIDSTMVARIGIATGQDSLGQVITQVSPGSMAADAGIEPGDVLEQIGEVMVDTPDWAERYRARYNHAGGDSLAMVVRRNGARLTLHGAVRLVSVTSVMLEPDPSASARAARIRHGILTGTTGGGR